MDIRRLKDKLTSNLADDVGHRSHYFCSLFCTFCTLSIFIAYFCNKKLTCICAFTTAHFHCFFPLSVVVYIS